MLHTSTQQLIRKLCELTGEGAIAWKEGDAGASIFETEGYLVEVKEDPPGIRLLHSDGRELERADAADLATPWPGGEGTYASNVALMANHAGRIARGAETAIAKILSSLSAPPKKAMEPEPEPAALAFDPPPRRIPSPEGATAIAAVSATLDAQRAAPPASHGLPEPAPVAAPPETETAIDRVLAIQPAPQPEPVITPEAAPTVFADDSEPQPEPEPEPEPASSAPPILIELDLIEPDLIEPEAVESAAPLAAPEPVQAVLAPEPAPAAAPVVEAAPAPLVQARAGFGAIEGFTRARPAAPEHAATAQASAQASAQATPQAGAAQSSPDQDAPAWAAPAPVAAAAPAEASKVTSTGLLMRGFSARTNQFVEPSVAHDYMRSGAPEPQPRPVPAPSPQPAAIPEKNRVPATPAGADIYKPWA